MDPPARDIPHCVSIPGPPSALTSRIPRDDTPSVARSTEQERRVASWIRKLGVVLSGAWEDHVEYTDGNAYEAHGVAR